MSGGSGIEKIIDKIAADAMQHEKEAIAAAESKRREIIKEMTELAEKKTQSEIEKARREASEQEKRTRSIVSLEKRKKLLETKREIIDNIYSKAEEYMKNMSKTRYISFLTNIAKSNNGGELIFSKRDKPLAQDIIKNLNRDKFTVSDKIAEDIDTGFILRKDDITINYSLKAIIKILSPELEPEIVRKLFKDV